MGDCPGLLYRRPSQRPITSEVLSSPWGKSLAGPYGTLEKKQADGEDESHTANLDQALQFVQYARANKSATAMLVAAQIVRWVTLNDDPSRTGEKSSAGDGAKASGDKADKPPLQLDAAALFEEACQLAGEDAVVIALIDQEAAKEVRAVKTRGRTGGAVCISDRVLAGAADYWPIDYRAGEYAQVLIIGDQDADLDCYVFDQANDLLVRDESYYGNCHMKWYTRYGGNFTVVVSNTLGGVYNNYRLCTD